MELLGPGDVGGWLAGRAARKEPVEPTERLLGDVLVGVGFLAEDVGEDLFGVVSLLARVRVLDRVRRLQGRFGCAQDFLGSRHGVQSYGRAPWGASCANRFDHDRLTPTI